MATKATKKTVTIEMLWDLIKEKWQIFCGSIVVIFLLQLLSTKVILSVLLGLIFTTLIPLDLFKKDK